MKVLYHYHSPDTQSLSVEGGNVIIYASKPTIINPGEIIKVPTQTSLKTDEGYYLFLTTHSSLIQKVCQMFGGYMIIDHNSSDKPLDIPIMNCGRNPVNIMPKQELVFGKVVEDTPIEISIYYPEKQAEVKTNKSTPQKKNTGVRFEMK